MGRTDRIYECLQLTSNYLFWLSADQFFSAGKSYEYEGNLSTISKLIVAEDLLGPQAGLYNIANGHQRDSQPVNGGCTPHPGEPDLTRCDATIPDIIPIKANHLGKEHRQTSATYQWSVIAENGNIN